MAYVNQRPKSATKYFFVLSYHGKYHAGLLFDQPSLTSNLYAAIAYDSRQDAIYIKSVLNKKTGRTYKVERAFA